MSKTLDDKLKKILQDHKMPPGDWLNDNILKPMEQNYHANIENAVAQIKQAFLKEYWLMPKHPNTYPDPLVMTGQEFFARFEKELGNYSVLTIEPENRALHVYDRKTVLEVAKKASGLNGQ